MTLAGAAGCRFGPVDLGRALKRSLRVFCRVGRAWWFGHGFKEEGVARLIYVPWDIRVVGADICGDD